MVLPAYQKKGIGRLLVKFAVENIETHGFPVYINSSESATSLYQDMGWKVVDAVKFDGTTPEDPNSGEYQVTCLVAQLPRLKQASKL
jgi:GNAT superfamily N-acetyltransferase